MCFMALEKESGHVHHGIHVVGALGVKDTRSGAGPFSPCKNSVRL